VRVFYEEFVDSRAVTIGRVLDALGINPREPEGKKGPMKQQADDISQGWVARFRQDDADQELTA
jgi:LPS sulfotransferase NodH